MVWNNKYDQLLSLFLFKLLFQSDLYITFQVIQVIKIVFFLWFCWQPIKGFNMWTTWWENTSFSHQLLEMAYFHLISTFFIWVFYGLGCGIFSLISSRRGRGMLNFLILKLLSNIHHKSRLLFSSVVISMLPLWKICV